MDVVCVVLISSAPMPFIFFEQLSRRLMGNLAEAQKATAGAAGATKVCTVVFTKARKRGTWYLLSNLSDFWLKR